MLCVRALSRLSSAESATPRALRPLSVGLVLGALALALVPSPARAGTWYIKGTVVNNTGSQAQNCSGGSGLGCVSTGPGGFYFDDASFPIAPTSPLSNGSTGSFSFEAGSFDEGADMYALYHMPDGAQYEITAEDDERDDGGTAGNYAACSQTSIQSSPTTACTAVWGGTGDKPYKNMTPKYVFGPSHNATLASVGQTCSGTISGSNAIDCTKTGQIGPVTEEPYPMTLTFANEGSTGVVVMFGYTEQTCSMPSQGDECTIVEPSVDYGLLLGALNPSSQPASYGVQVMGEAWGYSPPDVIPTWPPDDTSAGTPQPTLRALALTPGTRPARGARHRNAPLRPGARIVRLRAGADATISYTDDREATAVFRRARCAKRPSTDVRGSRCTRWVTLGQQRARSSLTVGGVRNRGKCRRSPHPPASSPRCLWRKTLSGEFAHDDQPGINVVHVRLRLAGHSLEPGLYRLTVRARGHSTAVVSRPRSVLFRIVK